MRQDTLLVKEAGMVQEKNNVGKVVEDRNREQVNQRPAGGNRGGRGLGRGGGVGRRDGSGQGLGRSGGGRGGRGGGRGQGQR